MYIQDGIVSFDPCDMHFVRKYGIAEATRMVQDFKATHSKLPFLMDTHQLANFLQINRKKLFDLTKSCNQHYREITLKKKNGKKRFVFSPDDELKTVQKRILHYIILKNKPSVYATAYIRKRSAADNAAPHVGKRYLLKIDITDFFGSIRFDQVYNAVFNTRYFPVQIGAMLTKLCCRKDVLPQGAPTSPALSNLVMRNFDDNIGKWCERHGIAYTRYCDDMTFSSDKPLYHVYQKVKRMLEDMGFALNEQKTRFVTNASRQSVTGLTVNEKVAVSREYKRRVRQEVHYALKFGEISETEKCRLIGKINYILQIEPDNRQFQAVLEQMLEL